jgi:hypothetical protein
MNRDAALDRFVGENSRELTDTRATKDTVKLLRQQFAAKHSLAAGARFTQRDAAERVVLRLVLARRQGDVETLVSLSKKIPWILESLGEGGIRQQVEVHRLGAQPLLSPSDLTHLNEENYLASVEEKISERLRVVATRQIADEHRQLAKTLEVLRVKQEDLQAKNSILESVSPEKALALESTEVSVPPPQVPAALWWQDIGLGSDPFLTNRGIYHIPKDKFESIVVETPFIKQFSDRIARSPTSLFSQAVMILGRYGSGKSTLFDILERKASPRGIIPLTVSLSPTPSAQGLLESFLTQLGERLGETFPDTFGGLPVRPEETADEMGTCIQAMKSAMKTHKTTIGFYILIDGLHKPDVFRSQTFEFVQYLQTFEERLDRDAVPCGIFIAGLPDWNEQLVSSAATKGSVSEVATIPELSVETAVEAVVRRISSFVVPGTTPPQIIRLPLRRGFEVLRDRLGVTPNFRDYLDDVKARLVARDYASVGVSITLHLETIQAVKSAFEASPLKAAYQRLMDPNQHSSSFRAAIKAILPAMVSQEGVAESSGMFSRNVGAFYVLRREGFIVKRWDASRGGVVWHLAESVIPLLQQLETSDEVLPTEALEALFVDERAAPPAEAGSIYGSVLRQLKEMANSWKGSWETVAELVDTAERRIRQIANSLEDDSSFVVSNELVRKSTTDLAIAVLDAAGQTAPSLDQVAEAFESAWCAPEDADEIAKLIRLPAGAPNSLQVGLGILHRHAGACRTLCDLLSDLVAGEGTARLRDRRLSAEEKRRIHVARTSFLSQQFQDAIDEVNDTLEKKIRDVAFLRLRCLGPDDPVSLIPAKIRSGIARAPTRGPSQLRRPSDRNFLYDVSRGVYSQVLFIPGIQDAIFASALTEVEVSRLREQMRLLFGLGSKEVHNDRPRYFVDHSQDVSAAIAFCVELIERLNDSIVQLFDLARCRLKFSAEGGLESSLVLLDGTHKIRKIPPARARAIGLSLVERLRRDRIRVPPLETAMLAVDSNVEDALLVTLAAVVQGRVKSTQQSSPFFIDLVLSDPVSSASQDSRSGPPPRAGTPTPISASTE